MVSGPRAAGEMKLYSILLTSSAEAWGGVIPFCCPQWRLSLLEVAKIFRRAAPAAKIGKLVLRTPQRVEMPHRTTISVCDSCSGIPACSWWRKSCESLNSGGGGGVKRTFVTFRLYRSARVVCLSRHTRRAAHLSVPSGQPKKTGSTAGGMCSPSMKNIMAVSNGGWAFRFYIPNAKCSLKFNFGAILEIAVHADAYAMPVQTVYMN